MSDRPYGSDCAFLLSVSDCPFVLLSQSRCPLLPEAQAPGPWPLGLGRCRPHAAVH